MRHHSSSICRPALKAVAAASLLAVLHGAQAFEVDTGSDLKLRWDNTLKYSIGARLSDPNSTNLGNANTDDSARNFGKHDLYTNRVDVLTEVDARYHNWGFQASAAGWYDAVYSRSTDNTSQATFNPSSVPVGGFPDDVKRLAGRRVELRNAFALGNFDFGETSLAVRLGRHTMLWGESLFFTDNGIAAGMAPVDGFTATTSPSAQAKEIFMPVNQLSATAVLGSGITMEGYYQLEWRKTRIPPAGTFFSPVDILDAGGERVFTPFGAVSRGPDQKPNKGQFGLSLRWRPDSLPMDLGFYALRYNDKGPTVVSLLASNQYVMTYKEGIQIYGISANTTLDSLNLGAEVSYRKGVPLLTNNALLILPGQVVDNSNPIYPVGDTVHYQMSAFYVGKAGFAWDNVTLLGEIGGHQLSRVSDNGTLLDGSRDRHALGMRGVASFDYYQVAPGLDLTVPITVGYNPMGKSPITAGFNNYGAHRGGDVSIGVQGVYRLKYRGGIGLTRMYGKEAQNGYRDRSFISANVSVAF